MLEKQKARSKGGLPDNDGLTQRTSTPTLADRLRAPAQSLEKVRCSRKEEAWPQAKGHPHL